MTAPPTSPGPRLVTTFRQASSSSSSSLLVWQARASPTGSRGAWWSSPSLRAACWRAAATAWLGRTWAGSSSWGGFVSVCRPHVRSFQTAAEVVSDRRPHVGAPTLWTGSRQPATGSCGRPQTLVGGNNRGFPPTPTIGECVGHLRRSLAWGTTVVPAAHSWAPWWGLVHDGLGRAADVVDTLDLGPASSCLGLPHEYSPLFWEGNVLAIRLDCRRPVGWSC